MPTNISWTDESWNPVTGCTPVSEGCAHCYAKKMTERFGGDFSKVICHPVRLNSERSPLHWRKPRRVFVCSMGDLFHEDVPDEFIDRVFQTMMLTRQHTFQVLTKRPKRMAEYVKGVARDVEEWPLPPEKGAVRISLVTLTKSVRGWPLPNVWLMVSAENQKAADERIPILLETPAAVRGVSLEPLLGPLDLGRIDYTERLKATIKDFAQWAELRHGKDAVASITQPATMDVLRGTWDDGWDSGTDGKRLDWVIVGGESSGPPERRLVKHTPHAVQFIHGQQICTVPTCPRLMCQVSDQRRMHHLWHPKPEALAWVRDIREQCQAAGVPFFFKQWGPRAGQGTLLDGVKHREMPEVRA